MVRTAASRITQDRIAAPSAGPTATGNRWVTEPSMRASAVPSRNRPSSTARSRSRTILRSGCLAAVTHLAWHLGALLRPGGDETEQESRSLLCFPVFKLLTRQTDSVWSDHDR